MEVVLCGKNDDFEMYVKYLEANNIRVEKDDDKMQVSTSDNKVLVKCWMVDKEKEAIDMQMINHGLKMIKY